MLTFRSGAKRAGAASPSDQPIAVAPEAPDLRRGVVPRSTYWVTLGIVCLGYFVASLAMGPVTSILPTITHDLDLSVGAAGWIMNVYFLLLVGFVLVMGRLGDVFGHGRVFGFGVVVVTVGQLLCGLSGSFGMLLAARALQGVGSAMVLGTSLAIIAAAVPRERRGRAIGILTMASSAATLVGVWLSTWSVQHLDWHWSFLLAVPLGIVAAALGLRLRLQAAPRASRRIDWAGAALLFATLTAGMLALNHLHEGGETFQAGAPYHVGMHVLTLALLVAFLRVEARAEAPLLGFKLLRDGRFSGAIVANGIAHTSMLATAFLLPFLIERGRGLTPTETGLLMMTQQAVSVGCSLGLGYVYDRHRSPWIGLAMMASIAGSLLALSVFGGMLPFAALIGLSCIAAAGSGGFSTVNNTAIMALAPDDQRGFASGLVETTRHFGHAVGVGLSSGFMAAALTGLAAPSAADYVDGFAQGALAMAAIAAVGLLALGWPGLRRKVPSGVAAA